MKINDECKTVWPARSWQNVHVRTFWEAINMINVPLCVMVTILFWDLPIHAIGWPYFRSQRRRTVENWKLSFSVIFYPFRFGLVLFVTHYYTWTGLFICYTLYMRNIVYLLCTLYMNKMTHILLYLPFWYALLGNNWRISCVKKPL